MIKANAAKLTSKLNTGVTILVLKVLGRILSVANLATPTEVDVGGGRQCCRYPRSKLAP